VNRLAKTGATLELIISWMRFILWSSRPKCSLTCGCQRFREIYGLHLQGTRSITRAYETLASTYHITRCYYTEDHHRNLHLHGNFRSIRYVIFLEMIACFLHPHLRPFQGPTSTWLHADSKYSLYFYGVRLFVLLSYRLSDPSSSWPQERPTSPELRHTPYDCDLCDSRSEGE
jgi:hypothetical protein